MLMADDCCLVTDVEHLLSRMQTNFRDRTFSAAGPRVWNYLPIDLRQSNLSYNGFRQLTLNNIFVSTVGPECSVNLPLLTVL